MQLMKYFFLKVSIITLLLCSGGALISAAEQTSDTTSLKKAFGAQVAFNTQACQITSPHSTDNQKWESPTHWSSTSRQRVAVAFVLITSDLLKSALDYWQHDRPDLTTTQIEDNKKRLEAMFLKNGQKTFLMLAKPTFEGDYIDEWSAKIPNPKGNVTLTSFDGRKGNVVRQEYIPEHMLYWDNDILSCLFWVEDVVIPESDPSYTIELTNVFFYIADDRRQHHWLRSKVASSGYVRFETNEVNVLAMIEKDVKWNTIEEKYIKPRRRQLSGVVGASVLGSIIETGINILMRAIFKL